MRSVEQLADLAPEDLENIPGIGEKTIERISDALSEYYTQLPSYQDEMERLAQEHMFSKDAPAPPEPAPPEPAPPEIAAAPNTEQEVAAVEKPAEEIVPEE